MQTARHSYRQHVVPHPPGAVGPIARKEAGADLRAELFIVPAALTARSCQPSIGSRASYGAFGRVVTDFSPRECSNLFRHAGYVRT